VALGAGRREILRLVVGRGMKLAFLGLLVGVPAALAMTRLMGGVLSGLGTTDPMTYVAVAALLSIAAFLASYLPAWRATGIDPLVALRSAEAVGSQILWGVSGSLAERGPLLRPSAC
jgi:putative ABC transport system permease protein